MRSLAVAAADLVYEPRHRFGEETEGPGDRRARLVDIGGRRRADGEHRTGGLRHWIKKEEGRPPERSPFPSRAVACQGGAHNASAGEVNQPSLGTQASS